MDSKRNNIEIMINNETDEVIEEIFKSILHRYQNNLDKSMKGSAFVFDYIHLLYYKCYKIKPNRGGSYTNSPDWIKKQESNNNTYQLLSMFCMLKKKRYILLMFENSNRQKEVVRLMIPNGKGWHFLAVKKGISFLKRNKM